ncbi:MAG: bifunctional UDP-3-O-[3-hydroxymyristoyl] N-acetylglucosamine deacetylase/3-hydroxyacyl-ACP dehydratase [bacterium]|jgi:UDP-3-O-[3-hydroxymyristoyl] N-acetylglucosamine deacetylase/3-hydroxyacyl-[acyl-carrier-protein] dehydratase|nr:bifunctional UDP-3-O-[3-hydroxymyristoyl] N-acetylglucosamine deacetylase/3-hydroxyacyl-ACP dehydratase [bacterium]
MNLNQRSIEDSATIAGLGLHTGAPCTVTFLPAPAGHGLVFRRREGERVVDIPATIEHVVSTDRGTVLAVDGVRVHTAEHLLAALAGLGIDNCLIEMDGPEPPILDGSAAAFIAVLQQAGIRELEEPRDFLSVDRTVVYHDDSGIDIVVVPSEEFRVTYMVDYANPALGTQYTSMYGWSEFIQEFAPARTFCFASELLELQRRGLIQGGSLDAALVFLDVADQDLRSLEQHFSVTIDRERLAAGRRILGDQEPHWPNEPVRHKVVDLAGDLCLLGQPLKAHVLVARGGHTAHVALVRQLKQEAVRKSLQKEYQQRLSEEVFDAAAIERILPHRYPFLLVDRITELKPGEFVRGIKCVTINEPFFPGHFPGHPIMPGVLIVEAMGQTGGILLLNSYDRPEEKVVYFTGLDKVRFRKPVRPGDQLVMELTMLKQRRGMCLMEGKAYVDGQLVTSAEMSAMVVDK